MITSKFRLDFWFGKIATVVGALALAAFMYYLAYRKTETFDYRSVWFWFATLLLMWAGTRSYKFLLDELKVITISERGISIKYLLREPAHIGFHEIKNMELHQVMAVRGKTRNAYVSHHELVITLHDGDELCFDGYQYKNFGALKSMIYHYVYHAAEGSDNVRS